MDIVLDTCPVPECNLTPRDVAGLLDQLATYHAHFVPDDDLTAGFYEIACERLNGAGIEQYEISNFARAGHEARHNLKYWTRQPYLGFGVDAHSMLHSAAGAIRFSRC